jgi:hypothetical protein
MSFAHTFINHVLYKPAAQKDSYPPTTPPCQSQNVNGTVIVRCSLARHPLGMKEPTTVRPTTIHPGGPPGTLQTTWCTENTFVRILVHVQTRISGADRVRSLHRLRRRLLTWSSSTLFRHSSPAQNSFRIRLSTAETFLISVD